MSSIHRIYVNPKGWNGSRLTADRTESNHILNVLRGKVGDMVIAFDGEGQQANARISSESEGVVVLDVVEQGIAARLPASITLIQAVPKGSRMDLIIEKATELGVGAIYPVISDRTISRPKDGKDKSKCERWRKIAQSASKQCGTAYVPRISDIMSFKSAVETMNEFDMVIVGSLSPAAKSMKSVIASLPSMKDKRIAVIIGPEGDLTPDELALAVRSGAVEVSFGELVLRVETAALFALSALAYELYA